MKPIPFTLLLSAALAGTLFAQGPVVVEVNNGGTWTLIRDGDLDPDEAAGQFGTVAPGTVVDRTFRITNNLPSDGLKIFGAGSSASEFTIIGLDSAGTIGTGNSHQFTIRFTAGTSLRTTEITIETSAPGDGQIYDFGLAGEGQYPAVITMEGRGSGTALFVDIPNGEMVPTAAQGTDFGIVEKLFSSNSSRFNIINNSAFPLVITDLQFLGEAASEFDVSFLPNLPFTLAPGGSAQIAISFTPDTPGVHTATVRLEAEAANSPFTFQVKVEALNEPLIEVLQRRDESLNSFTKIFDRSTNFNRIPYGILHLGEAKLRTFRVYNLGFAPLNVSSITGTNFRFQVTENLPTLAPGESGDFTIQFIPIGVGPQESLISVQSNAPGDLSSYQFIVDGFGEDDSGSEIVVGSPLAESIPPAAASSYENGTLCGELLPGGSVERRFFIRNVGSQALLVTSITSDNPSAFSVPNLNTSIAPGAQLPFSVTFSPGSIGIHNAVITIANNDPDVGLDGSESPYTINLAGTGSSTAPNIIVRGPLLVEIPQGAAASASLGTVFPVANLDSIGPESTTLSFTVENTGSADLVFAGFASDGPFSSMDGFPDIPPGQGATIQVEFEPSGPGPHKFPVSILTNDGDDPVYSFQVFAEATRTELRIIELEFDGDDVIVHFTIPTDGGLRDMQESTDLVSWRVAVSNLHALGSGQVQTRHLSGLGVSPASGRRYFRLWPDY